MVNSPCGPLQCPLSVHIYFSQLKPSVQKYLHRVFRDRFSLPGDSFRAEPVGGGSINDTYQLISNSTSRFFLKINSATRYPQLFEKEKAGLEFLRKQNIIRVPSVLLCEETEGDQLLLLEWIEGGLKSEKFWQLFGEQLAALHHVTNSRFGFEVDNYMGALPQLNQQRNNWIEFFIHNRLHPQIQIAGEQRLLTTKHVTEFEDLYLKLPGIFNEEKPSLLHGDLWNGNFICDEQSCPVLIDPAIYFGHRSVDLGMTTLFGGFDRIFYDSYQHHFPLPPNYREEWQICNLYPLLIHLNLFGKGYLHQIEQTLKMFS